MHIPDGIHRAALCGILALFLNSAVLVQIPDSLLRAAERGDAQAQNVLGALYAVGGEGVALDYRKSVAWYRKAAEQNHATAQYALGVAYDHGNGVARSESEAINWYRKAALQGSMDGQYSLGYAYGFGKGVTQDFQEAAKWFQKAAEQGYAPAQYYLGGVYGTGRGFPQNDYEAECANVFATHFGLGLGSIEGVIMAGWGCSARRFRGLIRVGFVVGKGEGLAAC